MTLEDLMEAMACDDVPGLTDDQQIVRLQEYYAQVFAQEPERFDPGQIVWHKNSELADTGIADGPHIFLEYLTEPIRAHVGMAGRDLGLNTATRVYDCIIGVVNDGFSSHFHESRQFTATRPEKIGD